MATTVEPDPKDLPEVKLPPMHPEGPRKFRRDRKFKRGGFKPLKPTK